MLDNINHLLTQLEQQEGELVSQLEKLRQFRATLQQARAEFGQGDQLSPLIPAEVPDWGSVGITEGTERLLQEKGPLDTRDIADALKERGVKTKSKNFLPTVYASLRESRRFVRMGRKWDIAARHPQLAAQKRLLQKGEANAAKTKKAKGKKRAAR